MSDPAGSARWKEVDEPLLHDAMSAEGLDAEVANSEGDATKFAAIADRMINDGVKVLVTAPPNNELLTANGGHVDGVLATDDGVAGAVIAVLRKKGLNGKVRVTGLGATPETLKAILRGDQFMTVFIPIDQQATVAAKLAGALARNDRAAADNMAPMVETDSTGGRKVRAVLVPPVFITLDTINQVIGSGLISSRDICDGELALRCDQLHIPR